VNETISIGIDLGTTNSSIVINRAGAIEIVKKPGGVEYTPSVFGFDKAKNKIVGQRAYESLFKDASNGEANNYKPEVKRIIGTPQTFFFERAGVEMNAEEISAEILKSLRQDVLRKYPDFDARAAVITIPAAFSVLQCEATKRAGNLAGFEHVVLLQEPIAAAVSYGFANAKNETWLVYDLGGGTFDVALISSREGVLSVLGHSGDNFLGGKNLDWEIVDRIIVPRILSEFRVNDFSRDHKEHRGRFARLKYLAERAKIDLSAYENTTIDVDLIGDDDSGRPIIVSVDLTVADIQGLMKPLVDRTITLCRDTLQEAGLDSSAISRIILVGGPTQSPYIRQRLEADLGIATDSSVDPLTVVARGACIFGLSQKIPERRGDSEKVQVPNGALKISLNYETLTADAEQMVTGVVHDFPTGAGAYFIKIESETGGFSGSTIPLRAGKFVATVPLEHNRSNLFWIYLLDERGDTIPVEPDSFAITHGLSIAGAPIPHSIGVSVFRKDFREKSGHTEIFEKLIEKGTVLPAKRTERFKTARRVRKDANENPLLIRVGEGESQIPDRNAYVCELGIKGSDVPRDLPEGTELDVTIEVNEIRELSVTAYIPAIDLTLNARSTVRDELIDVSDVEAELDTQLERARLVAENCSRDKLEKIDNAVHSVSASLRNAHVDEDEKRKAVKQLRDLKVVLDQTQEETELPQLWQEFTDRTNSAREIIARVPDATDRKKFDRQLEEIKAEGEKAVKDGDKALLAGIMARLDDLAGRALHTDPATWLFHFRNLTDGSCTFTNEREATYLVEKGRQAISRNDMEELKRCCRGLMNLLPVETQRAASSGVSGIMR
jgi:molecular chaperone DnaK